MEKEIKHTWFFNQSPQIVWEHLTKPELIEQWLGKTDFKPVIGHKFSILGKQGSEINCEVLEVKPPTLLSYSWQKRSAKTNQPFDSKVIWALAPKENGTELHLVHTGFTTLEDHAEHNNGWTILGNRLLELLNTITK